MENPIRILHLSDFHFSGRSDRDASPVLNDFWPHHRWEVLNDGKTLDLVAITGALAFSGSKFDYRLAKKRLDDRFLASPGPDHDCLLLEHGNHDVDRTTVNLHRPLRD